MAISQELLDELLKQVDSPEDLFGKDSLIKWLNRSWCRSGTEVSPALISEVTDAVLEEIRAWQVRPLTAVYRGVEPVTAENLEDAGCLVARRS